MSAEVEARIVRPDLFAECRSCPIAIGTIVFWLTKVDHNDPFSHIKEIIIHCASDEVSKTLMRVITVSEVQFTESGPILDIQGESLKSFPVDCPHFAQTKSE